MGVRKSLAPGVRFCRPFHRNLSNCELPALADLPRPRDLSIKASSSLPLAPKFPSTWPALLRLTSPAGLQKSSADKEQPPGILLATPCGCPMQGLRKKADPVRGQAYSISIQIHIHIHVPADHIINNHSVRLDEAGPSLRQSGTSAFTPLLRKLFDNRLNVPSRCQLEFLKQ